MTLPDDRRLPPALVEVARAGFDYADGEGVDFEPYEAFMPAGETTEWFRAWTGNGEVTGDRWRVFGQNGAGGLVAFWLTRPGAVPADQPVVFLGSEGEMGVLARDLGDFLWLLADGADPRECVDDWDSGRVPRPDAAMEAIAERYAPGSGRPASGVLDRAAREFPDFEEVVDGLCR